MTKLSLRRSQLIVPFGVGSIINMPDQSLMACGIDKWPPKAGERIYDERLQKRLNVKYFKMPASSEECDRGLPFVYFPKWLFCPRCRAFKSYEKWNSLWLGVNRERFDVPRCNSDKTKLVPARFIIACAKGHIDDFPWEMWTHKKGICSSPNLFFSTKGSAAGLEGIRVKCESCGQSATMSGAFDKEIFEKKEFKCTGHKPWQKVKEQCEEYPRTLQRGASNVYFPKLVTSINIPPFSDDICKVIHDRPEWEVLATQQGAIDEDMKTKLIEFIAKGINQPKELIVSIVKRMLMSSSGDITAQSENEYRYDEYRAFHGNIKLGKLDSREFSIDIKKGDDYKIKGIEKVVLVHRLRELRALVAFSRIVPLDRDELGMVDDEGNKVNACAVSIRESSNIEWFPAFEVRGEGIFLSFNHDILKKWASNKEIMMRAKKINDKYSKFYSKKNQTPRQIGPIYLMVHTFSHLLIRQLSFDCGYSSASLRERIYCNESGDNFMAGVLIYTASGDSEGTLGGLVRQGEADRLPAIIEKAVKTASWCSSDPVCINSSGQGLGSLNLAACHSCTLLPETCCEENNRLLDRGMVIGTMEKPDLGFFSFLL